MKRLDRGAQPFLRIAACLILATAGAAQAFQPARDDPPPDPSGPSVTVHDGSEGIDDERSYPFRQVVALSPGVEEAFVAKHMPQVAALCRKQGIQPADAQDIGQKVLQKFYAGRARRRGLRYTLPDGYLVHLIALDEIRDFRRQVARRRTSNGEVVDPIDWCRSVEEQYEVDELTGEMLNCLMRLPVNQRRAIVSYYFDEKSQAQIAGEMGVTRSSVARYLEKALESMRTSLSARGGVRPSRPRLVGK